MSYFTPGEPQPNTETNPTDQNTNQDDWLKKVVGEKGEQWSDPQVLAKGYVHASGHISELERQLAELRDDLSKQDYAKNLLEQLKEQGNPTSQVAPNPSQTQSTSTTDPQTGSQVSEEMLKGLIETTLTEREKSNTSTQNLQVTEAKLNELFGTEVEAKMDELSKALGMSKEGMQEIAAKSPTAFFKLVGEEGPKSVSVVPQSTLNTNSGFMNQSTSERNYGYYKELRLKNSTQYYSPKVQQQMLEDRVRLGDKFFN